MASESGGEHTFAGYISHHLEFLRSKEQTSLFDFSVVNLDTTFFALLCAAVVLSNRGVNQADTACSRAVLTFVSSPTFTANNAFLLISL